MITGVSFQPGQPGSQNTTKQRPGAANSPVQEAIKVLSLRFPRVVGAQAMAPAPLLNAQGSGGNPRVDSVVNQVLSRMLPTEGSAGPAPAAPMVATNTAPMGAGPSTSSPAPTPAPTFNGIPANTPLSTFMQPRQEPAAPLFGGQTPRVIVGPGPAGQGDFSIPVGGWPANNSGGGVGGVFESLPGTDGAQPPAAIGTLPAPGPDPMSDFLEFLRRNQFVQPAGPPEESLI